MVKTKSAYDRVERSDGDRILVSRFWPRGKSKETLSLTNWRRELAPSKQLLGDWKKGQISWADYTARYNEEMAAQASVIAAIAEHAKEHTVTLLCFEQEGDPHCHRHLLKKMIDVEMERGRHKRSHES